MRVGHFGALLALLAILVAHPVLAQDGADFYRGKTVTLIVSSAPGGGYDVMSRTIAKHLRTHLPHSPVVIIRNMPGAGGIAATNYLYSRAPRDGLTIGGVQNNTPFEPLLGTQEARYDPTQFHWLGSPSVEIGIVAVWHTVPVDSIDDMRRHEVMMGSTGANSTPSFYARLINETLGTKMRLTVGYPGQNDALLAVERGELDGVPSAFYSSLTATKPDWLRDGKLKLLLQYGLEPEPALSDVPFIMDLVSDPDDRALLRAGFAGIALGRPYLMPPGVPAERVAIMRQAFIDTFNDAEFRADVDAMSLGANQPRTGDQIQKIIADAYNSPPQVIDRLRQLSLHN